MRDTMGFKLMSLCGLSFFVAACAQAPGPVDTNPNDNVGRYRLNHDRAPAWVRSVDSVHNAVPRPEPRSRYGNPRSYVVHGKRYYVLHSAAGYVRTGLASWYGMKFNHYRTSSGEDYNMYKMTAASKVLPLPTYAKVTDLDNGRSVIVKVNDRGPFVQGRIIDLSYAAAIKLGINRKGTGHVRVAAINPYTGRVYGEASRVSTFAARKPVPTTTARQAQPQSQQLQVAAFRDLGNADTLASKIRRLTGQHVTVSRSHDRRGPLYKVQIGPVFTAGTAQRIRAELRRIGIA